MLRECCARTLIIHVCSAHEKVMFLVVILDRAINNNVACFVGMPDDLLHNWDN